MFVARGHLDQGSRRLLHGGEEAQAQGIAGFKIDSLPGLEEAHRTSQRAKPPELFYSLFDTAASARVRFADFGAIVTRNNVEVEFDRCNHWDARVDRLSILVRQRHRLTIAEQSDQPTLPERVGAQRSARGIAFVHKRRQVEVDPQGLVGSPPCLALRTTSRRVPRRLR